MAKTATAPKATKKPKSDCPLFLHQNGQWSKKVRGKLHYFGREKDAALEKWATERDYLLGGKVPPTRKTGAATITELCNLFVTRCKDLVAAGEMTERSVRDYTPSLKRLIDALGPDATPETLGPMDFATLKAKLANPADYAPEWYGKRVVNRSPVTVAGDIRRIRAVLNWATEAKLIPAPDYGRDFSPISAKAKRRAKAQVGRKDLAAVDIRSIIDVSSRAFKPVLLLGINGALGNLDVAMMRFADLPDNWKRIKEVWVDLPRNKTGADRRFLLWPETVVAIKEYLEHRADPAGRTSQDRLFLTQRGQPWVREEKGKIEDSIANAFAKYRRDCDVARGSYYDLRRTFATVASQTLDFPAMRLCMGHVAPADDMSAVYQQHVDDSRIRAVVNHVRAWLFDGVGK